MLPHVIGRTLMLLRCPEGRGEACFVQEHVEARVPSAVHPIAIVEGGANRLTVTIDDAAGLTALVPMGALEIHGWGPSADDVERPDRAVFDFNPASGVPFRRFGEAAMFLRVQPWRKGLSGFPMKIGGNASRWSAAS
jgi:bifunctional non-homologous end joining protein LigD